MGRGWRKRDSLLQSDEGLDTYYQHTTTTLHRTAPNWRQKKAKKPGRRLIFVCTRVLHLVHTQLRTCKRDVLLAASRKLEAWVVGRCVCYTHCVTTTRPRTRPVSSGMLKLYCKKTSSSSSGTAIIPPVIRNSKLCPTRSKFGPLLTHKDTFSLSLPSGGKETFERRTKFFGGEEEEVP